MQVNRELFKLNRVRHVENIKDPGNPIHCDTSAVEAGDISLIRSVLYISISISISISI